MAQQSARRGRKTSANHCAKSTPWVIWIRSANSHTGPQPLVLHQRPDRWQHPTTCNPSKNRLRLTGRPQMVCGRAAFMQTGTKGDRETTMQGASGELRSDLNRPFALFAIALCLPIIFLGAAAATILIVVIFSEGLSFGVLLILVLPVLGLVCARLLVVAVSDLLLPRPLLRIDEEGIFDRRLGCDLIAWDNVTRVTSLDPQQAGCLVELRTPVRAKFSRMRAGTIGVIWRLPPSAVYISMQKAMGPHIAFADIVSIAQQKGVPTAARRISKLTGRLLDA
jgi:hypothetical protein